MKIIRTKKGYALWFKKLKAADTIGFVPTMGALHEGHISLVQTARRENKKVVVSIFVNPTQFAPNEDFNKYPRTEKEDLALLKKEKVHAVFIPSVDEVYSEKDSTWILPRKELASILEGPIRPGHFEGVVNVVAKLFNITRPTRAYFGEKDYQQLEVIRAMVSDLFMPVQIVGCATIRAKSGLALSSRNQYLTEEGRIKAAQLYQICKNVDDIEVAKKKLSALSFEIQYLEDRDFEGRRRRLVAVLFQGVRLIDNFKR